MKGSKYTYADITPIAAVSTDYGAIVVPVSSPIRSLHELLAALRKDPAAVAVSGGSGPGAMHHGMIGVVAAAGGIAPGAIHYVGSAGVVEGIAALLRGEVAVAALGATDVVDELRTGAVRILAVLSEHRLSGPFQQILTAKEQGIDVVFPMWRGFYGPPEMPESAVRFWIDTFRRMVDTPTWARVLGETAWFPFLLTGDEFRSFLDADTRRYASALLSGAEAKSERR
jgi:putative tricarboxylic transport membrane protein